jgi:hypothetical protein
MTVRLKSYDFVLAWKVAAAETNFASVATRRDGQPNWYRLHKQMNERYQLALDTLARRDEREQPDLFREGSQ